MKLLVKPLVQCVLMVVLAASVGCGSKDAAADANKNLKPIDPNAPKPSASVGAGAGGGTGTPAPPKADAGPVK
jgi:hypothetical protein